MALSDNRPIVRDGDAAGGKQQVKDADYIDLPTAVSATYQAGRLSYDPVTKTFLGDTGFSGVRVNIGQEQHIRFFNDTGATITNGSVVNAQGVDATNNVVKGILADASTAANSSSVIGLATADVLDQEVGLATLIGEVMDFDTSSYSAGGLIYLSDSVPGGITQTRPTYPSKIVILGTVIKSDVSGGIALIVPVDFTRTNVSANEVISSQGFGAGTFYGFGHYDWSATDANLTQASSSVTYGTAGRTQAAHIGICPSGPGTVDTGQVGLQVVGIEDSETGPQVAARVAIITDDITTLNANEMIECTEKFSGNVSIEFYIVSGSPTTYSLDFNYGFSKYEDFFNRDATLIGFQILWAGDANDSSMEVELIPHQSTTWTYAATGFVPGATPLAVRSDYQQLAGDVDNAAARGAWKVSGLNKFLNSSGPEGFLVRTTTTASNTFLYGSMIAVAVSEELT